jgi:hypothetical protein
MHTISAAVQETKDSQKILYIFAMTTERSKEEINRTQRISF